MSHFSSFLRNIPFGSGVQTVDPNFSQWQLNAQDVIEILEHCLRGEIWNANKKTWGKGGKQRLNEKGIQAIVSEINSRVNKIVIMSNFTERNVNDMLWDLGDNLAAELFLRKEDWDIDFADMSPIHDLVMVITEATIKRAMLDGERRKIYEGVKTMESEIMKNLPNLLKRLKGLKNERLKIILIKNDVYDLLHEPLIKEGFNVLNKGRIGFPRYYNDTATIMKIRDLARGRSGAQNKTK